MRRRRPSTGHSSSRGSSRLSCLQPRSTGRWRPLLITAIFTGLRASELRGLRWRDIDFKANELHVQQRAELLDPHPCLEIGAPRQEGLDLEPAARDAALEEALAKGDDDAKA